MNAHQTTVTPEFSYSTTHESRFLCITFRGNHPIMSLSNITRKIIPMGGVYIKVFPSVNKVNLYTLHGPYCDIDIPLDDFAKAFDEKRPVQVKFLNNYNQLIEAYLPFSYVEWIVNGNLNDDIIEQHYFGKAEKPFIVNLVNDKETMKHTKNSFVYVSNMKKHDTDFDYLYYG